jgi:hypothetical protein
MIEPLFNQSFVGQKMMMVNVKQDSIATGRQECLSVIAASMRVVTAPNPVDERPSPVTGRAVM